MTDCALLALDFLQTDNCTKEGKNQFMGLLEAYMVGSGRHLACTYVWSQVILVERQLVVPKYPPARCWQLKHDPSTSVLFWVGHGAKP